MNEYIVEGTADGRPVKVRVFGQNPDHAARQAKEQLGARSWSTLRVTRV